MLPSYFLGVTDSNLAAPKPGESKRKRIRRYRRRCQRYWSFESFPAHPKHQQRVTTITLPSKKNKKYSEPHVYFGSGTQPRTRFLITPAIQTWERIPPTAAQIFCSEKETVETFAFQST